MAIIPQDSVVFNGSMRMNLDPSLGDFTDDQLWDVLQKVGLLKWTVEAGGLDGNLCVGTVNKGVSRDADTFGETTMSAGQRQLLCMARALLKKPRILVCDEATSSLDQDSDAMIKVLLKREFPNTTVLTIAHRLDTILDSDRIMVYDSGKLVEFDSPHKLMNKSGNRGYLQMLVDSERAHK